MDYEQAAESLIELFSPDPGTYGHYNALLDEEDPSKGGKLTGKRWSVFTPWTIDNWISHLEGKTRFGAMPLRADGSVRFMAADIDEYEGLDLAEVAKKLGTIFPKATLARSKSGGCHVYIFFYEDVQAKEVRAKMSELIASIGLGGMLDAIYPKQNSIDTSKDEKGTWINIPYHRAEQPMNYCFNLQTGNAYPFEKWLEFALNNRVSAEEFNRITVVKSPVFKSGPPCLEVIFGQGIEDGRNISLLNAGTFFKKSSMTNWTQRLQEANGMFENPIDPRELATLTASLGKKDYKYQCNIAPLSTYCDRAKCRMRKWGIGQSGAFPIIASLTKHNATPPVWWVYLDDGRKMSISTEALQNQSVFQRSCMEQLNMMPPMMERNDWHAMMQVLLSPEKLTIIDVPESSTKNGATKELIFDFLTSKATGDTMEDLTKDKPVLVEGIYYWRMKDLFAFVARRSMEKLDMSTLSTLLSEMGCKHKVQHIYNTTYQIYFLEGTKVNAVQHSFPTPDLEASAPL